MEDAPSPINIIDKEKISESFEIKQDEIVYKLNIEVINQDITMNLLEEKEFKKEYEIKLTLEEIKQIHKLFGFFETSSEFVNYIKSLIDIKKLSIRKSAENKITIELTVDYLLKQNIIKFDLVQKPINYELIIQDLFQKFSALNQNFNNLENNYKNIIEENKIIKEENEKIKERLNNLENIVNRFDNLNQIKKALNSSIMQKDEFDMIYHAIKERKNTEIKEIKKLYQATVHGGKTNIFHEKCDNVANTLILYKSAGNRRFGAFASKSWESKGQPKIDEKCFLFSLDKKKIFPPKNDNYYKLSLNIFEGPSFMLKDIYDKYCIVLQENSFNTRSLKTYEKKFEDVFGGDGNALSEDGNSLGVNTIDYEVFQIIF